METPKTAEEVLGETYAALLGSNKNFIIPAMEEYASIKAEQARREERKKWMKENTILRLAISDINFVIGERNYKAIGEVIIKALIRCNKINAAGYRKEDV